MLRIPQRSRIALRRWFQLLLVLGLLLPSSLPALAAAFPPPAAPPSADNSSNVSNDSAPTAPVESDNGGIDVPRLDDIATSGADKIAAAQIQLLAQAQQAVPIEAFVRRQDVGQGEGLVALSSEPINYQAEDGSWQPIDARFEAGVDGFANLHNLLQVRLAARKPTLEMLYGEFVAQWEPKTLELVQGQHGEVLANVLDDDAAQVGQLANEGNTVIYSANWSQAGLESEVVTGPGEAEHNLIFHESPATWLAPETPVDPNAMLRLTAQLRMPAGAQLMANGQRQTGTFTTTSAVELQDYTGATQLQLLPAFVFERSHPEQRIQALYYFTPVDNYGWLVTMETPWSWWINPARTYPVVWDPLMQMLRAFTAAQVYDNPACALYLSRNPSLVGVGRAPCIVTSFLIAGESRVRTLLRFSNINELNLPPGAELQGAVLLVAPTSGSERRAGSSVYQTCVNTQLHRITEAWNPADVNWNNQPDVDPTPYPSSSTSYAGRTDPPLCYRPLNTSRTRYSGTKWGLQSGASGVVTDWLNGTANFGLELRAVAGQEGKCAVTGGCAVVQIPKLGIWSDRDRDLNFSNDFEAMERGGFMLIIRYQAPALTDSVPYTYGNPYPIPPKPEDDNFHRTRHSYALPPANGSPWLAVAAKGFRREITFQTTFDTTVKQGLFAYPFWSQYSDDALLQTAAAQATSAGPDAVTAPNPYAYAFPLAVAPITCLQPSCEILSPGDGTLDASNFMLMSASMVNGREMRIDPLPPDPNLNQYAVEATWSQPLPAIDTAAAYNTGVSYEHTIEISSDHLVAAYHLNLPENTRFSIQVKSEVEGLLNASAWATARLFPPNSSAIYPKNRSSHIAGAGKEIRDVVPAGLGGTYGIVLELPGDHTAFDLCSSDIAQCKFPGGADRTPAVRTLKVTFTVRVCPSNAIPTNNGCAFVEKPNWNNTDLWREVPPYRIYSPAGFESCGGGSPYTCSKREANGRVYATVITWGAETRRMAVVAGNRYLSDIIFNPNQVVRFITNANPAGRDISASGITALAGCASCEKPDPIFEVGRRGMNVKYNLGEPNHLDLGICFTGDCGGLILPEGDQLDPYARTGDHHRLRIKMSQSADDTDYQYAEFTGRVARTLQTTAGVQTQVLALRWWVKAEGYAGWYSTPGGDGPWEVQVTPINPLANAPVVGLNYLFSDSWAAHYNPAVGYFTDFRNDNGRIVQPAELGGAWQTVDYLVLPFGVAPSGRSGLFLCPGYCGDIRAPDDSWQSPQRNWKMPDVLVNQLPQTVMVATDGSLQVFSSDHPDSLGQANNVGFSFKTFGARVEITEDVCPGSGSSKVVEVIRGNANISLPGLSPKDDPKPKASAIPSIKANFTLCQNELRQVTITFRYPPGIPIAQPPVLWVDMLGGTVTIGPTNVVIQLDVSLFIGATTPQIFKGNGKITLDTRGLFDLQATGRIMGVMDGEGRLWVAWNPLDLGMGSRGYIPNKDKWVWSGYIYAHIWRGSGWQNRYPWLAGNDDFHLAASYQAEFRVSKGMIIDEWPFVLPPGTLQIGVELSFGQFCSNDDCTAYGWGIKGKVRVAGFNVGLFLNLDCLVPAPAAILLCTSFILGSDNHILIDQYGGGGPPFPLLSAEVAAPDVGDGLSASTALLAQLDRRAVTNPEAPEVDEPLIVNASATSILIAFAWVRGAPQLTLIRPNDGVQINKNNAASHGVTVENTKNSLLFGIDNPIPGQWIARITNATPQDDYRLLYFANKETPHLNFTAPSGLVLIEAEGDSSAPQPFNITWTPPPAAANLRLSLFYSATVANPTSPDYQYGGAIIENTDPAAGSFAWDLSHLSTGDYRIYATLQDTMGTQVSTTGTDQYVGISTSIAPGTLRYRDEKGPPLMDPNRVDFTPAEDGVHMCWDVSPGRDLSEYVITYRVIDSLTPTGRTYTERILATEPYSDRARQCTRIGGLVAGDAVVDFPPPNHGIAARDASGNLSQLVQPKLTTVPGGATHEGPPPPQLSGSAANGVATLSWLADSNQSRWELFYARGTWAGPHHEESSASQGDSPIEVNELDFDGQYSLNGLTRGHWYSFAVRAYGRNFLAPPSLLSNWVWLLITDGVDSNGDGCPDDWYVAQGLPNGNGDADADGLLNKDECLRGTDPRNPDSDGDGWIDGDEVKLETDPLDSESYPILTPADAEASLGLPHLQLDALQLHFHAFTQGPNPAPQTVSVTNVGQGNLTLNVQSNQSWLAATVTAEGIHVNVNKAGLARGNYQGQITVTANGAGSPQTIYVDMVMLATAPGQFPTQGHKLYIPGVSR